MRRGEFKKALSAMGACDEAVRWAGTKTPHEAWMKCKDPGRVEWFLGRIGVSQVLLDRTFDKALDLGLAGTAEEVALIRKIIGWSRVKTMMIRYWNSTGWPRPFPKVRRKR